jgi:hypothetical protein
MKQLFAWKNICIAVGTAPALAVVYQMSRGDDVTTQFFIVACCTVIAAGAFLIWSIKSFLRWRQP